MEIALMRCASYSMGENKLNSKTIINAVIFTSILIVSLSADLWGSTHMSGVADLLYVKYDSSSDGKKILSASTLAQRYSLDYRATNMVNRFQPRFYVINIGYDWLEFDTKGTIGEKNTVFKIHQEYGKFKYSGEVKYIAPELPITFTAYLNNESQNPSFRYTQNPGSLGIGSVSQINDPIIGEGLVYNIDARGNSKFSGASLRFEPERSTQQFLYAFPKFLLDYREYTYKSTEGFGQVNTSTKELAVAGLNKENNWIQFRSFKYENFLNKSDNVNTQILMLGNIDTRGHRSWSLLTNWISMSIDGRLTASRSPSADKNREEYDANFMAVASRKSWEARTFMNYNRLLNNDTLTAVASVPVYVKGVYGMDTTWFARLDASRGKELHYSDNNERTSYINSISLGATTFNRSAFTLSPSMTLQTSKTYFGSDAYSVAATLESNSTRRFSDRIRLVGQAFFNSKDDGSSSVSSKSWQSGVNLNAAYQPDSKIIFALYEYLSVGNGSGYFSSNRVDNSIALTSSMGNYFNNKLGASASWTPTAQFSTSIVGSYDLIKPVALPVNTLFKTDYRASYNNKDIMYRYNFVYNLFDNGIDPIYYTFLNGGEVQYRPDRYHDGLLRLTYNNQVGPGIDDTQVEALQRYTYNLFTRSGVIRNLATVTQEYSYASSQRDSQGGLKYSTQYLSFHGRYSPTDKISLYGSVKYQTTDPGAIAMIYNAGLNVDFKLLTSSLDYAYARRDSDNRIEKRLTTSLRRSF